MLFSWQSALLRRVGKCYLSREAFKLLRFSCLELPFYLLSSFPDFAVIVRVERHLRGWQFQVFEAFVYFKVNVNRQSSQSCFMYQLFFFHIQIWLVSFQGMKKIRSQGVAYKLALKELKLSPNFSCYCSVK